VVISFSYATTFLEISFDKGVVLGNELGKIPSDETLLIDSECIAEKFGL
jgi:hypothetical protein